MPSIAASRRRALKSETGTHHDRPPHARIVQSSSGRSPGFVEGDRHLPEAGRDDGAALGEAGRHARAPSPPPEDGVGLRVQDRPRRVGAESRFESRRRTRRRAGRGRRGGAASGPRESGVGGGASGSLPRPPRPSSPFRDGSSRKPGPRRRTRWRTRGFCRSPTSTASSRPPRSRETEGSWPSCPIATGRWTCGSPRSAWVSSTT